MEQDKKGKAKYFTQPAFKILQELCSNPEFKLKVNKVREDWEITKLAKSFDEANKFWQALCAADRNDPNYHNNYDEGKTQHQQFQQALEALCQNPAFGLPSDPNMWIVMLQIVLRFDLDNVTDEDIGILPLPPSLDRAHVFEKDNRLYIDVTFASRKVIAEKWGEVKAWQESHIEEQKEGIRYFINGTSLTPAWLRPHQPLPDLLKDIKPGRPTVEDQELDLKAAQLRKEPPDGKPLTKKEIGVLVGDITEEQRYTLKRSRKTEERIKRGMKLMEELNKNSLHNK